MVGCRSYQLCLSEGEDVCTMLFSLEMKIPYIETEQSSTEGNFTETDDIEDNTKESDKIGDQIEDKIEEGTVEKVYELVKYLKKIL